ncbi:MAG: hypothetical protein FJ267_11880 [Planctomycetes bacterium]|nr:hypothetical protein [Planctomycetota bacterium]
MQAIENRKDSSKNKTVIWSRARQEAEFITKLPKTRFLTGAALIPNTHRIELRLLRIPKFRPEKDSQPRGNERQFRPREVSQPKDSSLIEELDCKTFSNSALTDHKSLDDP